MPYWLKVTPSPCEKRQITAWNLKLILIGSRPFLRVIAGKKYILQYKWLAIYSRKSITIWSNGQGTWLIKRLWFDSACGYVGFSLTIVPNKWPLHFYISMLHFTKQPKNNEYILYQANLLNKWLFFWYLLTLYFTNQPNNNKYVFCKTLKFLT